MAIAIDVFTQVLMFVTQCVKVTLLVQTERYIIASIAVLCHLYRYWYGKRVLLCAMLKGLGVFNAKRVFLYVMLNESHCVSH